MYQQVHDPVGGSLGAEHALRGSAARDAVRALGRATAAGIPRQPDCPGRGRHRRDRRLRNAGAAGVQQRRRRRGVRDLSDPVDRGERAVDLRDDRRHRPLPDAAPWGRCSLWRRPRPGAHRRVLVRRPAGGARGVRRTRCHIGRDAHRARLRAADGGRRRSDRQYRARGLRGHRHTDHHALGRDRDKRGRPRRHGRAPAAIPGPACAAGDRLHRRRPPGPARNMARRAAGRRGVRSRAVRHVELRVRRADRRRRVPRFSWRDRMLLAAAAAGRQYAREYHGRRSRRSRRT